jgi:MoaA/NifB/PqqE/SkfB family radical SAM enzyme
MSWNKHGIQIQLDTTTYCNAKCPQCHRTDLNGLGKVDWLPLTQWTFDDFKKAFSPDDLKLISRFSICPTWGDAIMNNHTKDMVEYIFDNNPLCVVSIDTNGSIRDEDWWWEFGLLSKGGKRQLKVIFAVDGINQEMHSKYRQETDLQKVLNNMKAFADTKSLAVVQTIIFKHNQNHIDDIKKLVKQYGASIHNANYTDRFETNNYIKFIDSKGEEQILEKADNTKEYEKYITKYDETIKCQWQKSNRITISFDGQVHPCCYFSNPYNTPTSTSFKQNELIKSYLENKSDLNIFNNTLSDIIDNIWYIEKLPDSWVSDNPVKQCEKFCSNRTNTNKLYKDIIIIEKNDN